MIFTFFNSPIILNYFEYNKMKRRTFLKLAGMSSLSFAAGCSSEPEKTFFTLVKAPDDMVTGKALWYASTCRECPAGCGILAKNREARVIKLEGNPHHPINKGKLCMRGQAALHGLYNPDRIKSPLLKKNNKFEPISFAEAQALLKTKLKAASLKGKNRVRMLTEITGQSMFDLFAGALSQWNSEPPLVFEPFAYESLKTANEKIFGLKGLPSYKIDEADFLLSFGADFLETWLSPVEYARKFKDMQAMKNGEKNMFFSVAPFQNMTAANADLWISCRPDSEAAIALALLWEIARRKKNEIFKNLFEFIEKIASNYSKEKALQISGINPDNYEKLIIQLLSAKKPLILGSGAGNSGENSLQTDMAVNLLNAVLDPQLTLFDFNKRHRIEAAAKRSEILNFFEDLKNGSADLLLLNNINPVFNLPPSTGIKDILERDSLFVVSFSQMMDETAALAALIFPIQHSLEMWDEYAGKSGIVSTLQPTTGQLTKSPNIGDVFWGAVSSESTENNYKNWLQNWFHEKGKIKDKVNWLSAIQRGGIFENSEKPNNSNKLNLPKLNLSGENIKIMQAVADISANSNSFIAVPSIRFFDGRGANKPWLAEIPDPITKIAWQTPVIAHSKTLAQYGLKQGDVVSLQSKWGKINAPVYESSSVIPGVLLMSIGQGHEGYGRYAENAGLNPLQMLSPTVQKISGAPFSSVNNVSIAKTGEFIKLAHTDGSRVQHDRKIALSATLKDLARHESHESGLTMNDFPLTLPLPEGYDPKRDMYPPHEHDTYRWGMVVDLDKCIGCGACAAACYAENNLGIVGVERILDGREMSWIRIERYHDAKDTKKITFFPMLCQHCDNAPCEAVCPVYAPHHSKEGLNNQIYNRCIGTRFCAQNCPYKVRRFNWFDWKFPEPMNLQLNPEVTVRSKGVMEKCSFCVQRIKDAHGIAKNEKRKIKDGEIQPACVQTCPTGVFTFGNLMDKESRVRKLIEDRRAYQAMGYLNTKPAVIYLKKVAQEI
jgi:molybdopterin-containing oxidoreductase family iron-sulfur binding subunit